MLLPHAPVVSVLIVVPPDSLHVRKIPREDESPCIPFCDHYLDLRLVHDAAQIPPCTISAGLLAGAFDFLPFASRTAIDRRMYQYLCFADGYGLDSLTRMESAC